MRISEISRLQVKNRRLVQALGSSYLHDGAARLSSPPLEEILSLRTPDVEVSPDTEYNFAGVFSFGRGVFRGPIKKGSEFSYTKLTRLHTGNFVYPKLMAWEGAFGVVGPETDGLVVSPEFPVFDLQPARVLPETLQVYFGQPHVWETVSGSSRGTNVRRRRLHPKVLLSHRMPLPPLEEQLALQRLVNVTAVLAREQDVLDTSIAALMPSLLNQIFNHESPLGVDRV
jgi:type I restriction enzyme S subunit